MARRLNIDEFLRQDTSAIEQKELVGGAAARATPSRGHYQNLASALATWDSHVVRNDADGR